MPPFVLISLETTATPFAQDKCINKFKCFEFGIGFAASAGGKGRPRGQAESPLDLRVLDGKICLHKRANKPTRTHTNTNTLTRTPSTEQVFSLLTSPNIYWIYFVVYPSIIGKPRHEVEYLICILDGEEQLTNSLNSCDSSIEIINTIILKGEKLKN